MKVPHMLLVLNHISLHNLDVILQIDLMVYGLGESLHYDMDGSVQHLLYLDVP